MKRISCLTLALLVMGAVFSSGCHSTGQPASASFASVVIQNHTSAEIQAVTERVFAENGYTGGASKSTQMIFNKEGSRANTVSRDGLLAAQSGAQTIVRVKAELVEVGGGSLRLQCQAYMVTGAGDSFFEEEHKLSNIRSGPYQKILNQVVKRLKEP